MAIVVTDDNLVEMLLLFNADAEAISRRGKAAMMTPAYAKAHALIDSVLCDMGYEVAG